MGQSSGPVFRTAFTITIVGGLILAATFVVTIPGVVLAAGWLLFLGGLALAFLVGYRASRQEGRRRTESLGRGLRTLWKWLRAFMP